MTLEEIAEIQKWLDEERKKEILRLLLEKIKRSNI